MDAVATHAGRIGFRVRYPDGRTFTEADGTWDDVPEHRPIAELAVIDLATGEAFVELSGMPQFFFMNEAVGVEGGALSMHTAKILGGLARSGVTEVRLEIGHGAGGKLVPMASRRTYHESEFRYAESSLRPGAGA